MWNTICGRHVDQLVTGEKVVSDMVYGAMNAWVRHHPVVVRDGSVLVTKLVPRLLNMSMVRTHWFPCS